MIGLPCPQIGAYDPTTSIKDIEDTPNAMEGSFSISDVTPNFLICSIIKSLPILSEILTAATFEDLAKALLIVILPS